MKKKTKLSIITALIFSTLLSWISFANGQWMGQWEWQGQQKWKEIQMSSQGKKINTQENKKDWFEMNFKIEAPLTNIEIEKLIHQWEDEYAAIGI